MGKVESITVSGLDLWFNSSDHSPPHFHARKPGTWEIRVFIMRCTKGRLDYEIKWPRYGKGPNGGEQRQILAAVLEHRDRLLVEWEQKVIESEVK